MRASPSLLALMVVFVLFVSCGGFSMEEDSTGAKLEVVLSNDLDNPPDAIFKRVVVNDGSYTPDLYIIGLRYLELIRCLDTDDAEMTCPGDRGEEIDNALAADESMEVFTLNEDLSTDSIIYASGEGGVDGTVGNSREMNITPVDEPGFYSGLRMGLDFVMTAFPGNESNVSLPSAANGFEFALLCLNEDGCSTLAGYEASYLDGLTTVADASDASTHVQVGDIVFLNSGTDIWYWWNLDANGGIGGFAPLSSGRPANPLNQDDIVDDLIHGDDGEWVYNASFGSTTPDGLAPLDITQELIDAEATDTLTSIFSVEDSMSFEDDNGNNLIDSVEMESFRFGKPRIIEMTVTDGTFSD